MAGSTLGEMGGDTMVAIDVAAYNFIMRADWIGGFRARGAPVGGGGY